MGFPRLPQIAPFKNFFVPLVALGACWVGAVVLAVQTSDRFTRWGLVVLLLARAMSAGALVVQAFRSIRESLSGFVDAAHAVTHGRTRHRVSLETSGVFLALAKAFNQMIDSRLEVDERLRLAHESLELKVQARTVELFRANKALREESEQRAQAERDFQQAQKMDALGKLAGSIAHDFNNLLTVIIGSAELARKQIGDLHSSAQFLRTIEKTAERAAGLTRPLLTFSRNQFVALEPLCLNDAADEASRMLQRLLGVNLELELNLAPDLRLVKVNGNQMQQVLINLAVNGRDAMEGIGTLTITTRNTLVPLEFAVRHGVESEDHWVELAVSDTGCGMDDVTKARIFEPFFTTKPVGRGTGLGLATVFGIVKQFGGFLDVDSTLGVGTTFRVFLPAPAMEAAPEVVPADVFPDADQTCARGELLLLVDDEEDIRELATITLESYGYRIISAGNAETAILLAEKHAAEISALITDVMMPGMSGVELVQIVAKIVPALRVLFVSGHSNETLSAEALEEMNADYLQKPYLGQVLISKVRDVLAAAERPSAKNSDAVLVAR